ncbi:GPI alpha-1,6-mannosyltransferase 2 isoform X2 [Carettochelys insculpta]|uniref:GPI alpha-1,6-mannosyltransferase 2 isoform X2 n=1 Tax=Carettochelys insculpta TaxID=44489 RepID=UPI003EB8EEBB
MKLMNRRDPYVLQVIQFAVCCRALTLVLQVTTRFLGSSSPVLYWFCAHLLLQYEPLLWKEGAAIQTEASLSEKPTVDSSVPGFFRKGISENPILKLLLNWRISSPLTKCILGYFLSYWLLGLILHCNFLPWT